MHDIRDLIGEDLLAEAYDTKASAQLNDYGRRLMEVAHRYSAHHGVTAVATLRYPPDNDLDSPSGRAHLAFAAARWCLWWSERGHGLVPWC